VLILLTKVGIDVKYSTRIMEWFNNELPLCSPHLLQNKELEAMAEIIAVQQEENFLAWTGMIQLDMQLRS
jgi:hypothetical protein